jgi:endonuclease YncB( thermonuclease family)
MTFLRFTLAPLLFAAACLYAPPALADNLTGQASVIDGDTLDIHGQRIRVFEIDAPEPDQLCRDQHSDHYRCGQKASLELDDFIARRPVDCVEVDRDRYGRAVAVCTVAGVDLADRLVRKGLAVDWPKYSKGGYAEAQAAAQHDHLGLWGGSFSPPWTYRACRRSGGRPGDCSDADHDAH